MKVKEFIEKLRDLKYKYTFEFRENNQFLKEETVNNVSSIENSILEKYIDIWFVDFFNNKIVIDMR